MQHSEPATIPWRDWNDAAFQAAKRSDRPIFLYLTTQWGHAVHQFERNTLSDSDIIDVINRDYVPIKVDSVRRPDVFDRYNQGGWPSICILTPEGILLHGRTGVNRELLLDTLTKVSSYYSENRKAIEEASKKQGEIQLPTIQQQTDINANSISLDAIRQDALAFYDTRFHGFGNSPKFAMPELLLFLLEDPSDELRRLAFVTLETLRISALYDHLGGGFHRSCEKDGWRSPTFEKLLYDNVAILETLLEAFRQTRDENFSRVANDVISYLESSLGDPSGVFYNAQDSDPIPGDRTGFYGWTAEEIREAIEDKAVASLAIAYYGIGKETQLPGSAGKSALEERVPVSQLSLRFNADNAKVLELLEQANKALKQVRSTRKDPGVDEGVILSDQGRAMGVFAQAGILLNRPRFLQRAFEIGDLIWSRARREEGGVPREFGSSDDSIFLIDQVDVTLGYLELYRIAGRANDLIRAEQLGRETWDLLGDPDGVGCFDHTPREKDCGAVAAAYTPFDGNSRLLLAILLLSSYTQDSFWHEKAMVLQQGLETLRPSYRMQDAIFGRALRRLVTPPPMVDIITGDGVGEMRKRLIEEAPSGTLIRAFDPDQHTPWTPLERYPSNGSRARAVVFVGEETFEPTHDIDVALMHLNERT